MALRYEIAPTVAMARVELHGEGGCTASMRVRVDCGVMSWDRLVELNGPQPDLPVVLSYARTDGAQPSATTSVERGLGVMELDGVCEHSCLS